MIHRQTTKKKILDTAEKLFALHGFNRTSLRQVTGEAGTNLAAVNYYFGSKNGLFEAIMDRRITPLNAVRLKTLNSFRENQENLTVRNILFSFIHPTLQLLNKGRQKRYFVQLVGRVLAEPDGPQREIFHRHMMPAIPHFVAAIQEIRPHLSKKTIIWGLHFSIGATTHCIRLFCNPSHFLPSDVLIDLELMEAMLMDFVTSGLEATYA